MTPEDRLTAYALNDPSVCGAERAEIEQRLATDAEVSRAVEETRKLADRLGAALQAEAAPADVVPLTLVPKPSRRMPRIAALAASVLLAAGLVVYAMIENANKAPEYAAKQSAAPLMAKTEDGTTSAMATSAVDSKKLDMIARTSVRPDQRPGMGNSSISGGISGGFSGGISGGMSGGVSGGGAKNGSPDVVENHIRGYSPSLPTSAPPTVSRKRVDEPYPTESSPKLEPGRFGGGPFGGGFSYQKQDSRFPDLEENAFTKVEGQAALSTFGIDVDTASYSILRKFLSLNQLPPANAVRLEEMVNYFPYRDAAPVGDDPFAVTVELAECPWNPKNRLARIGLKAKPINFDKRPPSNLVFLIDISGSMMPEERLPLVKKSLKLLVDQLNENDRVALVVYASGTGVVLDSTSAVKKQEIIAALDRLEAGGSTNGSGGIQLAYEVAVRNFIPNGTNRIILCTDGDWNVGVTSTEALLAMIEEKRKTNVFLSVFGFGFGNLRDEMMVKLAGKGNGNYAYIGDLRDARKALVEQAGGTLVTVAKDVKIQVEFNPAKVGSYRLLGYEKRKLAAKDFHDDTKDAGEMGAGHVVTALYELTPAGVDGTPGVEGLRYQGAVAAAKNDSKEAFVVKLRHKLPASDVSTLREVPVLDSTKPYGEASEDFRFSAAVASFAMLLRDSPYKGNATFAAVQELAQAAMRHDPGEYRAEFVKLVGQAKQLAGKP